MTEDFPCAGCGVCCMHMSVPPYDADERKLLQEDWPQVYADLVGVEASRELQLKVHGTDFVPCGFFDHVTRKCRHHEQKPDICRQFEIGSSHCNAMRKDGGLPAVHHIQNAQR